jgi:hypothetical protein
MNVIKTAAQVFIVLLVLTSAFSCAKVGTEARDSSRIIKPVFISNKELASSVAAFDQALLKKDDNYINEAVDKVFIVGTSSAYKARGLSVDCNIITVHSIVFSDPRAVFARLIKVAIFSSPVVPAYYFETWSLKNGKWSVVESDLWLDSRSVFLVPATFD